MRKILITGIIGLMPFCLFGADLRIPPNIVDSIYPNKQNQKQLLILKKVFKGNFTGANCEEYIAFYYPQDEQETNPLYEKIIIYQVKDSTIINQYSIYENAYFDYNEIDQSDIKKLESFFGKWNGYFYLFDLNKNGVNEIIFFPYGGLGLGMCIYEFKDNKFISLADTASYHNVSINVDTKESSFTFQISPNYEDRYRGIKLIRFVWDKMNGKYVVKKK